MCLQAKASVLQRTLPCEIPKKEACTASLLGEGIEARQIQLIGVASKWWPFKLRTAIAALSFISSVKTTSSPLLLTYPQTVSSPTVLRVWRCSESNFFEMVHAQEEIHPPWFFKNQKCNRLIDPARFEPNCRSC
jgi:hypothetical protein